jgi:hypothetical protein
MVKGPDAIGPDIMRFCVLDRAAEQDTTQSPSGLEDRPGFLVRRAHQISQYIFVEECPGLSISATQFGVLWVLGRAAARLDKHRFSA